MPSGERSEKYASKQIAIPEYDDNDDQAKQKKRGGESYNGQLDLHLDHTPLLLVQETDEGRLELVPFLKALECLVDLTLVEAVRLGRGIVCFFPEEGNPMRAVRRQAKKELRN